MFSCSVVVVEFGNYRSSGLCSIDINSSLYVFGDKEHFSRVVNGRLVEPRVVGGSKY